MKTNIVLQSICDHIAIFVCTCISHVIVHLEYRSNLDVHKIVSKAGDGVQVMGTDGNTESGGRELREQHDFN